MVIAGIYYRCLTPLVRRDLKMPQARPEKPGLGIVAVCRKHRMVHQIGHIGVAALRYLRPYRCYGLRIRWATARQIQTRAHRCGS
jgi:hypothetical protein